MSPVMAAKKDRLGLEGEHHQATRARGRLTMRDAVLVQICDTLEQRPQRGAYEVVAQILFVDILALLAVAVSRRRCNEAVADGPEHQ